MGGSARGHRTAGSRGRAREEGVPGAARAVAWPPGGAWRGLVRPWDADRYCTTLFQRLIRPVPAVPLRITHFPAVHALATLTLKSAGTLTCGLCWARQESGRLLRGLRQGGLGRAQPPEGGCLYLILQPQGPGRGQCQLHRPRGLDGACPGGPVSRGPGQGRLPCCPLPQVTRRPLLLQG